ncbi:hypothetical protein [Spirosoma endbachense]|uniref:Uncharacterized protein n=1 Tax=Spirosoma endbachense TaxID=2666025 RepID=A0A6P1W4T3_9BACT|nr:hypothetical protein [Spirosoma endbachense]QHV99017.1 hypothetical protein GJR95_30200 [Spirosoma endbachense]
MKATYLLVCMLLSLLSWQCSSSEEAAPPKLDYDQASRQLMNDLAPQIVGR